MRLSFEDERGRRGETQVASFATASDRRTATSFVWTGDSCGQGWGINPDLGGLVGYRRMLETRPDFFLHSGDTIYADGPIAETVVEPDGQVWRNVVAEGVEKVAESLDEYRGRHRYTHLDDNFRGARRRRADRRPVGRPRDPQQLVSRAGHRRRPLHREARRRARAPGPPGLAGVPADRRPPRAPAAATGSRRPGSTARSSAAAPRRLLPRHAHLQGPQHRRHRDRRARTSSAPSRPTG